MIILIGLFEVKNIDLLYDFDRELKLKFLLVASIINFDLPFNLSLDIVIDLVQGFFQLISFFFFKLLLKSKLFLIIIFNQISISN